MFNNIFSWAWKQAVNVTLRCHHTSGSHGKVLLKLLPIYTFSSYDAKHKLSFLESQTNIFQVSFWCPPKSCGKHVAHAAKCTYRTLNIRGAAHIVHTNVEPH